MYIMQLQKENSGRIPDKLFLKKKQKTPHLIFFYILKLIYLAAPGLSFSMQDLVL